MKLLVDECLHTSLVTVAHSGGHSADHVSHRGLGGLKDWQLMRVSRAGQNVLQQGIGEGKLCLYQSEERLYLFPRIGRVATFLDPAVREDQLKNAPLITAFVPLLLVLMTFTFTWPVMLHL